MSAPLAEQLDVQTAGYRREVEKSFFMQALFQGWWGAGILGEFVRCSQYVSYLQCLRDIYGTVEERLFTHCMHPALSLLRFPELLRTASIDADLCSLVGAARRTENPGHRIAALHCERLELISTEKPELLIGHIYALYMGDILPGPFLGTDLSFYAAIGPLQVAASRRELDDRLNSISLQAAQIDEVIREAQLAFRLRQLLLEELARVALGLSHAVL